MVVVQRRQRFAAKRPSAFWSMDFVADELAIVGKSRLFTVVNIFARQALAVDAGQVPKGDTWFTYSTAWSSYMIRPKSPPSITLANSPVG